MRSLRRLALALLFLQAPQLLIPGAAVACLRPAGALAGEVPTADEHAGHHMPAEESSGEREHDVPAHCPAATSCAVAAVTGVETSIDGGAITVGGRVAARDDARPASIGLAPEPPPPRG